MALTATIPAAAQQPQGKLLTMEETILSRALSPASYPVRWVGQSDSYSVIEGSDMIAVNARTGKRTTLITLDELNRLLSADFKSFPPYAFEDENTLAVTANGVRSSIDLRRSSIIASNRVPTGANLTRQPGKGGRYAYTRDNNLYYFDGTAEHPITSYEDRNIVCGQSVSRNEFGITGGIFFAPDASKIAFYRKDESRVTDFPLVDITTRTGTLRNIKYPMNGMASEHVDLGIYDIATGRTVYLTVTDFDEERYLTNITWSPDAKHIFVQVLDRRQKNMHLNMYDVETGRLVKQLLTEHNDRFVEPQYPLVFLRNDPPHALHLHHRQPRRILQSLPLRPRRRHQTPHRHRCRREVRRAERPLRILHLGRGLARGQPPLQGGDSHRPCDAPHPRRRVAQRLGEPQRTILPR